MAKNKNHSFTFYDDYLDNDINASMNKHILFKISLLAFPFFFIFLFVIISNAVTVVNHFSLANENAMLLRKQLSLLLLITIFIMIVFRNTHQSSLTSSLKKFI